MRIGSLFSGAAGLDGAVQSVFGGEIAWHSEVDPAASKVLAYRFPDVPNLGDITKVDWAAVEPVDVLCGGFPCQDVSAAGRRAGIKDGTRSGLWSIFAEAIDAVRPSYVVVENVRGLLNAAAHRPMESEADALGDGDSEPVLRAIGAVLGDLSDLGYDAQWATVSAASIGAPHRRERVFILAEAADTEGIGRRVLHTKDKRQTDREVNALADHRVPATVSSRDGWHEGRPEPAGLVGGSDAALSGDGPVELLPTPCAQQSGNTPENHLAKKPGRKVVTDLAILVENGLMATGGELLPTPAAQSAKHDADDRGLGTLDDHNLWSVAARIGRGELLPTPRATRGGSNTETVQLLPTPNAQDGNGGKQRSPEALARGDHQANLTDLPRLLPTPQARDWKGGHANQFDINDAVSLLPTPRSSDCFGAGLHGDGGMDLRTTVVENATQWGKYAPAIRRWEQVTRSAPPPTEPNSKGNPRLSAAFSEWMIGWPEGWVTQVPGISRNDQLRIIGNGVVVLQAAAALRWLLSVSEAAA